MPPGQLDLEAAKTVNLVRCYITAPLASDAVSAKTQKGS